MTNNDHYHSSRVMKDESPPPAFSWRFRLLEVAAIAALAVAASTCLVLAVSAPAHAQSRDEAPTRSGPRLRAIIVVAGPTVTIADAFTEPGTKGAAIIAPAPADGATSQIDADYLVAAAKAAGLAGAEANGLARATITRRSNPATGTAPAPVNIVAAAPPTGTAARMIHRGEMITLRYDAPGFALTLQARALSDAAEGDSLRVLNLQSNRAVDATAIAPGIAAASPVEKAG